MDIDDLVQLIFFLVFAASLSVIFASLVTFCTFIFRTNLDASYSPGAIATEQILIVDAWSESGRITFSQNPPSSSRPELI